MTPILLLLALLFIALAAGIPIATRVLRNHSDELSTCPDCGSRASITDNIMYAQLLATCENPDCKNRWVYHVQPRAFSLFGVVQLYLTFVCTLAGFKIGFALAPSRTGCIVGVVFSLIIGGYFIRLLVRIIACGVLCSDVSAAWKEEAVSHMAPTFPLKPDKEEPRAN